MVEVGPITAPPPSRYVAKEHKLGSRTVWGVYDREHGSWPVIVRGLIGRVQQDMATREEAELEAKRCEALR